MHEERCVPEELSRLCMCDEAVDFKIGHAGCCTLRGLPARCCSTRGWQTDHHEAKVRQASCELGEPLRTLARLVRREPENGIVCACIDSRGAQVDRIRDDLCLDPEVLAEEAALKVRLRYTCICTL